jgi:microcystin-dependent protein
MAQPYVGEVRMFAGNFAPAGWMTCAGQLLSISEYETLFQLIGTTYGGDGQSTFALPDLRGRIPIHQGNGYVLAQTGGVEQVTLSAIHMPQHTHSWPAVSSPAAVNQSPVPGNAPATSTVKFYKAAPATVAMAAISIQSVGNSQPHTNMMPYLCVNYIISLYGIFPSPT